MRIIKKKTLNTTLKKYDKRRIFLCLQIAQICLLTSKNFQDEKIIVSYHNLGQKVKDFDLKTTTTNQYLNKGIYLLEIEKNGLKTTKKLIVN